MNLEDQVVSLELAKKLKELGVKQESLHIWHYVDSHQLWQPSSLRRSYIEANYTIKETYSAFTVAELGEMLPTLLADNVSALGCFKKQGNYEVSYLQWSCSDEIDDVTIEKTDKKEADARAKMLIYLIENKLIEV